MKTKPVIFFAMTAFIVLQSCQSTTSSTKPSWDPIDTSTQPSQPSSPYSKRFVFFNEKDSIVDTLWYCRLANHKIDTVAKIVVGPKQYSDTLTYNTDAKFFIKRIESHLRFGTAIGGPFGPSHDFCYNDEARAFMPDLPPQNFLDRDDPELSLLKIQRNSCRIQVCTPIGECSQFNLLPSESQFLESGDWFILPMSQRGSAATY
ncbi:MAG: hypothetical protein IPK50_10265 [Fibrobacterota bacterium]|nr:hypothetical protein [Fibrobacterota bacterium]QQS07261.1 MAG: hypothetical protein IPK50_10265 [Fibrobacterota bacterium]